VHALKRIQTSDPRDLNPETRLLLSAESVLFVLFLFIGFADYAGWPSSDVSKKNVYLNAFSWQLTAQEFIQPKIRSFLANSSEAESKIVPTDLDVRMNTAATAGAAAAETPTVQQSGLSRELSVDSIVSKLSWSCSLYGRTAKRRHK
jgi:hypothetical protein